MLRILKKSSLRGNKLFFDEINEQNLNNIITPGENHLSANLVKNEKSRLRKLLLNKRKNLSEISRASNSLKVLNKLFSLEIYKKSQHIALYHPINSEVDTYNIFQRSMLDGKKIYFPKITSSLIHFYNVQNLEELEKGYKGILEPKTQINRLSKDSLDLILLPGLGFDKLGNRLGYGGGFYDKYLEELPRYKSIALAFDFQILDYLPTSKWDVKVGRIITESKVVECFGTKGGSKCKP